MEQMQFCAIMLLSLLTLTLACLPTPKRGGGGVLSRSRWLMAGGTALLVVQFLLQYTLGLRTMGVTQAVMVNLLLFIPASWLLSLSVLYLQRQGRILRHEWLMGAVAWAFAVILIVGAVIIDGKPLLSASPEKQYTEWAGALAYAMMQVYYTWLHLREMRRMHRTLDNFFDHETGSLLQWMERSIWVLAAMAAMVPLMIFGTGWFVTAFALFLFFGIYYLVISFVCYTISNASHKVQEAEDIENDIPQPATDGQVANTSKTAEAQETPETMQRVEHAIEQWLAAGGHLHSGITIQTAANEMNVPRYLLTAWLKTTPQKLFNPWLTYWRIEEAKRLMREHPDCSFDWIAERCGFSSRNYFHTVFRRQEGLTPAAYAGIV